MRPNSSVTM